MKRENWSRHLWWVALVLLALHPSRALGEQSQISIFPNWGSEPSILMERNRGIAPECSTIYELDTKSCELKTNLFGDGYALTFFYSRSAEGEQLRMITARATGGCTPWRSLRFFAGFHSLLESWAHNQTPIYDPHPVGKNHPEIFLYRMTGNAAWLEPDRCEAAFFSTEGKLFKEIAGYFLDDYLVGCGDKLTTSMIKWVSIPLLSWWASTP